MVGYQCSLLALGDKIAPRPLGPSLWRTELGVGAWIDIRRDWIAGADALFEQLIGAVAWEAEQRRMYDRVVEVPRLCSFYAEGQPLPHPALEEARAALVEHYRGTPGGPLRTAGFCLYRDGRDSVAWHGDRIGRGATSDTLVAIISLGAPRALLLRPSGGGTSLRHDLGAGDLLVMGGSCQRTYEHAVPKTARAVGPRISVQFRPPGVR